MERFAEEWLIDNQFLLNKPLKDFMRNRLIVSLLVILMSLTGAIILKSLPMIIFSPLVGVVVYTIPVAMLKGQKKDREKAIMKVFPDWIATLQTLVLVTTIPNAVYQSVDSAPKEIQDEVRKLSNAILAEPLERQHYLDLLKEYDNANISEVMLSLYQFNFSNKDDLAYEFEVLHNRIDRIAAMNRRQAVEEKAFFYGLVLMVGPGLATGWIMFTALRLAMLVMGGI